MTLINKEDPTNEDINVGMKLEITSVNRTTGEITVETDWTKFVMKIKREDGND